MKDTNEKIFCHLEIDLIRMKFVMNIYLILNGALDIVVQDATIRNIILVGNGITESVPNSIMMNRLLRCTIL